MDQRTSQLTPSGGDGQLWAGYHLFEAWPGTIVAQRRIEVRPCEAQGAEFGGGSGRWVQARDAALLRTRRAESHVLSMCVCSETPRASVHAFVQVRCLNMH